MSKKYSIKAISMSSGVLPQTLRVWEERYNLFNPGRGDGGQREYSEQDLNKAIYLKKLTEQGHTISHIALLSLRELKSLYESAKKDVALVKRVSYERALIHIKDFAIAKLKEEISFLKISFGIHDFIFKVALPLLSEVGELVYKKELTVTQEHLISNVIVEEFLNTKFQKSVNEGAQNVFAFATPDGNLHELPLMMGNLLCHYHRHESIYLGASHPADSLALAMNKLKPTTLVLGTLTSDNWNFKKNIQNYLAKLDDHLTIPLPVILGGGESIKFKEFKYIQSVKVSKSLDDFDDLLSKLI